MEIFQQGDMLKQTMKKGRVREANTQTDFIIFYMIFKYFLWLVLLPGWYVASQVSKDFVCKIYV